MDALRLDVACAVIDDAGAVLLTPHIALAGWALPEGPLDTGEQLRDAAARTVAEETGVIVHVDRPVGVYYWVGLRRMTVLFAGWPLGGELARSSGAPRAVRYFAPDALPAISRAILTFDALAGTRHKPRSVELSRQELQAATSASPWRLISSWLRLRRYARSAQIGVDAAAVIVDESHRRLLTVAGEHGSTLPRVHCHAEAAPWDQLAEHVASSAGFRPSLRWVGVRQDLAEDRLEFVFAATTREAPVRGRARWSTARNNPLAEPDALYVANVRPGYARDPVWFVEGERSVAAGDTLVIDKEIKADDASGSDRSRAR